VRGRKALVIDPALAGPLTLLVQTSVLKARSSLVPFAKHAHAQVRIARQQR
jgi:hypothetical protein